MGTPLPLTPSRSPTLQVTLTNTSSMEGQVAINGVAMPLRATTALADGDFFSFAERQFRFVYGEGRRGGGAVCGQGIPRPVALTRPSASCSSSLLAHSQSART